MTFLFVSHFCSLDFPPPGVPSDVVVIVSDSPRTSNFSVFVTWKNSEPESEMDFRVMSSYLQWGTGKTFDDVFGVATVNGVSAQQQLVYRDRQTTRLDCKMDRWMFGRTELHSEAEASGIMQTGSWMARNTNRQH